MRREVQAFVVHYTFMDDGCKWKGEVRHLEVDRFLSPRNVTGIQLPSGSRHNDYSCIHFFFHWYQL